jgi:hypothetical protein
MGMVLRLTDEETERLRHRAERDHRSMQQVVRIALNTYLDEGDADVEVHAIGERAATRWASLLDRLGK